MSDIKNLIKSADRLIDLDMFVTSLKEDDHTVHSLNIHKQEIIRLWENFREIYEELCDTMGSSDDIAKVKAKYIATYKTYVRGLALIESLIEKLNAKKKSSSSSLPIHLPPCDTEIFSGDYKSWPTFRDMFSALYKDNEHISNIQKMYYLMQKTEGEARDIIKTCPITNEGFQMAWQNLVDRYENKRVLVNAQLKILFNLAPVLKESGPSIKQLQRTMSDCITNLSLLGIDTKNWDVVFVFICSTRLPEVTLGHWEQSQGSSSDLPKWETMDKFLTARYQTLESVFDIKGAHNISTSSGPSYVRKPTSPKRKSITNNNGNRSFKSFSTTIPSNPQQKCPLCSESHPLRLCEEFLQMSVNNRLETVKRLKCCTNCLASSHTFSNCKSSNICFFCKQKHHSHLHRRESSAQVSRDSSSRPGMTRDMGNPARSASDDVPSTSEAARSLQTFATAMETSQFSTVLLGTTVVDLCCHGVKCSARALIDPASQATFISRKLQKKLALPIFPVTSANIVGLNGTISAKSTNVCRISLCSPIDPTFELSTDAYVVDKLTGRLPTYSLSQLLDVDLPEVTMCDLKCSHMDLLLGGDIYSRIMHTDVHKHPNGDLIAQKSVFGWIVTGKVSQTKPLQSVVSFYSHIELNDQLARFWEIEDVPKVCTMSEEDRWCEELYLRTTYRNDNGRYVVSLPFKREYPKDLQLGLSRNNAISQFKRNESRLMRNPELKIQYDRVLLEYADLGHMTMIDENKVNSSNTVYYLPHHAVFKPDSATTKLRVVFNASSVTSNGVSLNNVLYTGPVLQANLIVLILRWRLFRFVFNADIEKMYRQILIHPDQASYQRIVFRLAPDDIIQDFELNTVTFGVNCAPYLAIRTLLRLADDVEGEFPTAAEIIRSQMYVDDILAGAHSLDDAMTSRDELMEVLGSAGFNLRKWTSNVQGLLLDLPPEYLLDNDFLNISNESTAKTLGLRWNAGKDVFFFKLVLAPTRSSVTKRAVLSEIAKLFDPAGWLAPKIIVAKIIMQQIWKDKTDWDECLKPMTLNRWFAFLDDYSEIERIEIPRWVGFSPDHEVQLHAFCDASEKAYAASLYVRIKNAPGDYVTHLLAARTKVAPIKVESLPRLELCGATLLADMVETIRSELSLPEIETFYWTDSTIVLSWLQKPPCHWPTFVANRVANISTKIGTSNWHHVLSHDNPADIASRGSSARDLLTNNLWWKGPAWLCRPRSEWPKSTFRIMTNLETKPIQVNLNQLSPPEDILASFSDLSRALRVLSYVFRFFHRIHPKFKSTQTHSSFNLEQGEINFVKGRLVVLCQRRHFPEYVALENNAQLSRKSPLLNFNPFIDSDGFMRMNGRLARSPTLTYDERFPKILPYDARFTRLYLEYIHKNTVHGENALMLRLMRLEFWVPRLKNLVRTIIHNCRACVLFRKKTVDQIMAALPPERTTLSRPFTCTGVDFAGPFDIKTYIGRGCRITKGYVLVFVCFATKAIHLEATNDMSTDCFIAAFTRFFSRRGCPSKVFSDNGTSFVGASNVLGRDQARFLAEVKQNLISLNAFQLLEWKFIPPGAPHMGGLWEAGVKSFKTHLKKVSHAQKFTFEEFSTMLARIEACLNSRPLSPMSDNPNDLAPLTPGHFLIGSALLSPPEPDTAIESLSYVNRWQKLKVLSHSFAKRWKEEYLVELHKRNKWKFPQRDFAVGDLVVIRKDNLPPPEWKVGRIEKIYLGPDNKVRVVDIRVGNCTITRPVVKLVLLPVDGQN
ncbi:uncharacterized protein LOC142224843 [Haematobia irritans]|uniref:uncharacterized protein LOC142224843 n=1 Tax=Haematobia irritans TaxID=7368 RepID=UPI003F50489C